MGVLLLSLVVGVAAEIPADVSPDALSGAAPVVDLIAPVPLVPMIVALPADTTLTLPVQVEVIIGVDPQGEVDRVILSRGAGAPFDEAVLTTACGFSFAPATFRGEPVEVEITFTQTFEPPVPVLSEVDAGAAGLDPATAAVLRGHVIEKGLRSGLPLAWIIATDAEGHIYKTTSAADGAFSLAVPAGRLHVEVVGAGHKRFGVDEDLEAGELLEVRYMVERLTYDPYATIIVAKRDRTEVSRVSLRDRELRHVPGTFGDPFRVIGTLPGVSQLFSLINYPIVRGTSPGNTGYLIDGVSVPLLFHFLAGPSVIHPEFVDKIDFYPGGFPVHYGGYIGGVVDGLTRRARSDEDRLEIDLSNSLLGVFWREPIETLGVSTTVAGRFGFPGLMLSLFTDDIGLYYGDYQARVDGRAFDGDWTVFAFGAIDDLQTLQFDQTTQTESLDTALRLQFHRLDLTYGKRIGDWRLRATFTGGYDETFTGADAFTLRVGGILPRLRADYALTPSLSFNVGFDGAFRFYEGFASVAAGEEPGPAGDNVLSSAAQNLGWLAEMTWKLGDRLSLVPGVRVDRYSNSETHKLGADPRLLWKLRLFGDELDAVSLKGVLGLFHQPPRFFIPLPGLEEIALSRGLLRSYQAALGVEGPITENITFDVVGYFTYMDPLILDLALNPESIEPPPIPTEPTDPPVEPIPEEDDESTIAGETLFPKRIGRSYGVEAILKHRSGGPVFGWLSATLSWSERRRQGAWIPFDFDRRLILNAVVGFALPRNWELGLRGQFQTGRPVTTLAGYNKGRTPPFVRVDLRVDKRAVFMSFLFDFYIDVINVTWSPESFDISDEDAAGIRYMLPSVGVRGVF